MKLAISAITIDCHDASRVAEFWAAALHGSVTEGASESFAQVELPDGPTLCCTQVPEAKPAKNRVHFDLGAADIDAEVKRLEGLGASTFAVYTDDGCWTTMRDVEQNEFCVVAV